MSLDELSQLFYLDQKIQHDREQIAMKRARLTNTSVQITGMPHGSGAKDKIGDAMPEIVDDVRKLEEKVQKYKIKKDRIMEWIDGIDDMHVQMIFTLRFVDLMSWQEVADAIGGKNSEYSVKKMAYRYLNEHE